MSRRRLEVPESELPIIEKALSEVKDARTQRWLLGIRLVCLKRSAEEAGMEIKASSCEVRRWVNRFNKGGIEAMRPHWGPGRATRLTAEQLEDFRLRIRNGPGESEVFSTWRGRFAQEVIRREYGVSYKLTGVYKLLHRLGFSSLRPRPQYPGASEAEREEFKKKLCRKRIQRSAGK